MESSHWRDLKLLEDVTEGLAIFADFNASVGDLRKLRGTLVTLGKTLQQERDADTPARTDGQFVAGGV